MATGGGSSPGARTPTADASVEAEAAAGAVQEVAAEAEEMADSHLNGNTSLNIRCGQNI